MLNAMSLYDFGNLIAIHVPTDLAFIDDLRILRRLMESTGAKITATLL
jgi:hypothetical protein